MTLFEFFLLSFMSLIAIVEPISTVPIFLAITPANTPRERRHMARMACLVATAVLLIFAITGKFFFDLLGVSMSAFQISGGLFLFIAAVGMVQAQEHTTKISEEEKLEGEALDNVAIAPMAVPLLAGPGAISTIILLLNQAPSLPFAFIVYINIIFVMGLSYVIFCIGANGSHWINPMLLKVLGRLMGLVVGAVAVQFVINGLKALGAFGPAS